MSERAGQAAFNALHDLDQNLANEIRGTHLDPFYDDERIPAFVAWLALEATTLRAERQQWQEERALWRELVTLERVHAALCGDPYCTTDRCVRRRELRRRLGLEERDA